MNSSKLAKLYQTVLNPWKMLDKLLFSESLIEKSPTFKMKCFLTSYGISVGVFFDKRANKTTRKFLIAYHVAITAISYVLFIFYLTDLKFYDIEAVAIGVVPFVMTTMKIAYAFFVHLLFDVIENFVEFLINDYDVVPNSTDVSETSKNGLATIKKWVIFVTFIFFGFHLCTDVLFDSENEIRMNSYTKHPHLIKFFPMWCPFESTLIRIAMSLIQDAFVLPEVFIYFCGSLTIFLSVLFMNTKFEALYEALRSSSKRTFDRIEILDKNLKETMSLKSKVAARLRKIKNLEEEKTNTMAVFYENFVSCVKRFQQLQRICLLRRKCLNIICSLTYCHTLLFTICFGFFCAEGFSSPQLEFNLVLKMLIWFLVCGCIWLLNCFIGDLYSKQNDSFAEEVYSMPWYNFSPKQRKTVFTLLTIIQKPIYLRALNLVNVTKEMFPDWLNSVYSYVQIMQTFQKLKHRDA